MQKTNIKTKLLTVLLTLCMVLSPMSVSVFAVNLSVKNDSELEAAFENDITKCKQVTRKVYDERSLLIRAKEQFSRLLSPLL